MMHNETTDVTYFAQQYNSDMAEIMVKHAPIKTKKIKIKHHQPWFNYTQMRNKMKKVERKIVVTLSNRIQFIGLLQPEEICCKFG